MKNIKNTDIEWRIFRLANDGILSLDQAKKGATAHAIHIPTGIDVKVDDTYSYFLNREKALQILEQKLNKLEQ